MKKRVREFIKTRIGHLAAVFFLLFLLTLAVFLYSGNKSKAEISFIQSEREKSENDLNKLIGILEKKIKNLEDEKSAVENILTTEQKAKFALEEIQKKSKQKIDELEKLTTYDPELLKKYSKVYFLSENYEPPITREVDEEFWINEDKEVSVLKEVSFFLHDLLRDARDDGIDLKVLSGYRSFDEQTTLKSTYTVIYGSGANQFSADQGYSEHQLGTTVDFTTSTLLGAYTEFENTTEFEWLQENAHKYGFVMSYPKNNGYYVYEPWHWRFVGVKLASDLDEDKLNLYELDQRDIDKYLIKIFDK